MYGYGGKLVIQSGGSSVGATLMRTGQTTVYRTGDDADTRSEGRATDFFTLASNTPFGNTDRFTSELGTQTYTNNIVIDWSTYNGSTVLGYKRTDNGGSFATWNQAIDGALLTSIGTFTSGWRLPNLREMYNIVQIKATTDVFNYAPFNLLPSLVPALWTSTRGSGSINFIRILTTNGNCDLQSGSVVGKYIACRTFTVTGTTLT
jgi:hypothetical protein